MAYNYQLRVKCHEQCTSICKIDDKRKCKRQFRLKEKSNEYGLLHRNQIIIFSAFRVSSYTLNSDGYIGGGWENDRNNFYVLPFREVTAN